MWNKLKKIVLVSMVLTGSVFMTTIVQADYCSKYGHSWSYSGDYKQYSETVHKKISTCYYCDATQEAYEEHDYYDDDYDDYDDYVDYDDDDYDDDDYYRCEYYSSTIHKVTKKCYDCGQIKIEYKGHNYHSDIDYSIISATEHYKEKYCYVCKKTIKQKEKHKLVWSYGNRECSKCDYVEFNASTSSISNIYPTTTKVTVKTEGKICKGDIVTLQVGSKKYKKTVSKNAKNLKLTFTIKKPGTPSKKVNVIVTIKHKNRKCDEKRSYVYIAKGPRVGMTQNQVKLIAWGEHSRKTASSGGYVTWYWDDYSYVMFRNGKVAYWYDAAA